MKIGDIVTKDKYTQGAIWCNKNNAHIEKQDGKYIIVENEVIEVEPIEPTPTLEERVGVLEGENEYLKAENEALNDTMLGIIDMIDTMQGV